MPDKVDEFNAYRKRMNDRILAGDNLVVKRFFNLDSNAYQEGALSKKTKDLMGLVASMVLRCDDCIRYHLQEGRKEGVSREEFEEAFSIALVVGGSIVIPHLRRAVEFLDALDE